MTRRERRRLGAALAIDVAIILTVFQIWPPLSTLSAQLGLAVSGVLGIALGKVTTWWAFESEKQGFDMGMAVTCGMLAIAWGIVGVVDVAHGTLGDVLALGAIVVLSGAWILKPSLWQLRHPRKAWWMAHTGRKIVDEYEAACEEALRRAEPRQIIAGTSSGTFSSKFGAIEVILHDHPKGDV